MSYIQSVKNDIEKLNFTNLYLAEILISDYLNNSNNYVGLTVSEITSKWNENKLVGRYRKMFYPSYCQRKISQGSGLLNYNTTNQRFSINDSNDVLNSLLNGELIHDIQAVINAPNPILDNITFFENIHSKQELFAGIKDLLFNGTANDFEVMSFAILSLYLELYGFNLKRFTSTNANDGGVDFIGGDIVYCVTTNLSRAKLDSDVLKTHAKKVFIYRTPINSTLINVISTYVSEDKISDVFSANDLVNHHLFFLEGKNDHYKIVDRIKQKIVVQYGKEIL
jgi:hypothetical protein